MNSCQTVVGECATDLGAEIHSVIGGITSTSHVMVIPAYHNTNAIGRVVLLSSSTKYGTTPYL